MPLSQGTLLQRGRYTVVRFLSHGGFGCTYLCRDNNMQGRQVAVKEFYIEALCRRDESTGDVSVLSQSQEEVVCKLRKKFLREARKVRSLSHPGVVRVYDVFEERGTAYFVMDFVSGGSLKDLLKKHKALAEDDALRYVREVGETLSYVHSRGLLHLDIKPDNIMLDAEGRTVLIDFGVSKQVDARSSEGKTLSTLSTITGYTPGFASIEQMANDPSLLSQASDVYSLAATLHALLTGNTPPSAAQIMSGKPLGPLPGDVSEQTAAAIREAMRVTAADRTPTVDAFLAALPLPKPKPEPEPEPEEPTNETVIALIHSNAEAGAAPCPRAPHRRRVALFALSVVTLLFLVSVLIPRTPTTIQPLTTIDTIVPEALHPAIEPVTQAVSTDTIPVVTEANNDHKSVNAVTNAEADYAYLNREKTTWRQEMLKSVTSKELVKALRSGDIDGFASNPYFAHEGNCTNMRAALAARYAWAAKGTGAEKAVRNCLKASVKADGTVDVYGLWDKLSRLQPLKVKANKEPMPKV